MCGIFGVFYRDPAQVAPESSLRESARLLRHRGPDAEGVHAGRGIGLASTRLALVDPDARSNQPFWDETGRYALVFNGEIYNFRELRAALAERGVAFHTTSDTEVVLRSLIHDEPETVLPRLGGMFAFAFHDTQEGTLLLARDRFGMKPLYLYEDGALVAFGSEVKAFRPWVEPGVDQFSIASYLLGFGGPTKGATFYRGVTAVAPGELVRIRRGRETARAPFFSLPDFWDRAEIEALDRLTPKQTADRFEQLLWQSVERHLFADSAVGAFCSGGVDSSLILAMAAKQHSKLAIFHANVVGPWSELHAARQLAQHLKLDLRTVDVQEREFLDRMPEVMRQYEHPFTYHPNCAPFMMVARLAHAHGVKGMLSGEGSDELFLGYPWLARERLVNRYHAIGRRLGVMIRSVPAVGRILLPEAGPQADLVRDLLNRGEVAEDEANARRARAALGADTVSHANLRTVDYLEYHLRTLLHRNDSLGMESSIEARFPFLDHDLVRTAVNMPSRYKLRFSPGVLEKAHPFVRDKWVVRAVADRWLPKSLSRRKKIGFWTTAFERTRVAPEYFVDSHVRELFAISSSQARRVAERAGQDLVMRLLHLDVWAHVCLHGLPLDASVRKLNAHVTIAPGVSSEQHVGRNFLALGGGEAFSRIIAFGATVYLARVLGVRGYGIVALAVAVTLYLAKIADFAIEAVGAREVAHAGTATERLVSAVMGMRLALALALVAVSVAGAQLLLPDPERKVLSLYFLTLVPIALSTKWVHLGRGDARPIGIARIVGESAALLLIVTTVHGPPQLWLVPIATFVGESIPALLLYAGLVRAGFGFRPRWDPSTALSVFRRAAPLLAQLLLGLVLYNSALVFLRLLSDARSVGFYASAYTLISFIANLGLAYGMSLLPALTRLGTGSDAEPRLYHTAIAHVFAVCLPLSIGGCFVAPGIIRWTFGARFTPAAPVLQILIWAVPLLTIRVVPWAALIARGQQKLLLRATALTVAANVVLNLTLILRYGMTGAALSTVLTESLAGVLMLSYAARNGLPFIAPKRLLRPLVAGGAMTLAMLACAPLPLRLSATVGTVVYLLTLVLLRALRFRRGAVPVLDL